MQQSNILVTESAIAHFEQLIQNEEVEGMGLRIFIEEPGVINKEVGIAFCAPGENNADDLQLKFDQFTIYVDAKSAPFLQGAEVDYLDDKLGGQLSITAPKLKGKKPASDASLFEKVEYVIQNEINGYLASHGGSLTLVEVTDSNQVIVRFNGGCHGCGMAGVTLKQGIETSLKEQCPEITEVLDVTNHATGDNPYY